MKKFTKVVLIIAASLFVMGIGLTTAGVVMGAGSDEMWREVRHRARHPFGWDDGNLWFWSDEDYDDEDYDDEDYDDEDYDDEDYDDEDYDDEIDDIEQTTVALSEKDSVRTEGENHRRTEDVYSFRQVKNLEIELRYDELILEEHEGEDITVEVINDSRGDVIVREGADTLEIRSDHRIRAHRIVKVCYPEGMEFREADISVGAGKISIDSDFRADELDISIGAGEFENSGEIIAGEASFEVGTGTMTLIDVDAQEISGECGTGTMELNVTGEKSDYSYSLECGIGSIRLDDQEYSGLGREKDIQSPGASGYIELDCGIGTITVDFI